MPNRHTRRANGQKLELPPGYAEACEDMTRVLRAWLEKHPDCRPRFRLGPDDVWIVAPLDTVLPRVCLNDDARVCAELVDEVARIRSGDGATLFMFGIVLQTAGVPYERTSLAGLGLQIASLPSRGGDA